MKLKVISDTLFKRQPKLSKDLPEAEKVFVKNGTEYELKVYAKAPGNHYKIVLANTTLGPDHQDTWYVYQPDVEVVPPPVILQVVSDTLFKLEPVLSSQLSDREKVFVKNGSEFKLHSYLPAENNHTRVALADSFLGPENRNTWYTFNPDIKVNGSVVVLNVVSDTLFKLQPKLSSELANHEKFFVKNGTTFVVSEHEEAGGNHIKVTLQDVGLGSDERRVWYAYKPDVHIEGNEPENKPNDSQPAKAPDVGIQLPGFSSTFYLSNPILPNGHFTWGEATHGGTRIPVNENVVYGIIRVAKALEEVRSQLGNRPLKINSWYRDPVTNKAVGGASRSRHLQGDAVDFVASGIHPYDVYDRLNKWWGSRGGLASASVFTHIDTRGYYARWSYGY